MIANSLDEKSFRSASQRSFRSLIDQFKSLSAPVFDRNNVKFSLFDEFATFGI